MSSHEKSKSNRSAATAAHIKDGAAKAASAASQKLGEAQDAASEKVESLRETAQESYINARDAAYEWETGIEERIRRQPLKSLAIAAAAGFILSIFWGD